MKDFAELMTALGISFNRNIDKKFLNVYYEFLKDIEIDVLKKAIGRIITINKFFPSIAEIREVATTIGTKNLQLNAEEEWQNVLNAIRNFDVYDGEKAIATLKPYTAKIVKMIGWYRLCMSENIVWEKKEFINIFNQEQKNLKEYQMLGKNITSQELSYKEQLLLEEQEIENQNLLEMEGSVYE